MKPTGIQIAGEYKGCLPGILNDLEALEQLVESAITNSGMTIVRITSHRFDPVGITVAAILSESHVVVHTYPEAEHASVDIYTCTYNPEPPMRLFEYIQKELQAKRVKYIEIFRGDILDKKETNLITTAAGNGFEIRYEVEKLLFSKKTDFQQLEIIENAVFGRMLFLDNDLQIADSDAHIYNEAMVAPAKALKEMNSALILGGGDGGIANQLIEETNCEITLVDIDPLVIEACKEYMPKVAGKAFKDERVTVLNKDADKFLKSIENNYDAVFYDLSMHPEIFSVKDKQTYLTDLFGSLKNTIKTNGVLSMQCCSAFDKGTLEIINDVIPLFFHDVKFNEVFIPSFCEPWIFASVKIGS